MKKMLRNRKGFSLVELLIALLIMAVIAAVAITLFGGVLGSSKVSADKETAENIKRQVLLYMNQSNDVGLLETGTAAGTPATDSLALITKLSNPLIISGNANGDGPDGTLSGTYGPYFDVSKRNLPQQANMKAWAIVVNKATQVVTVKPVALETDGTLTFAP
jgi:type IV pilus assembly protein PilA